VASRWCLSFVVLSLACSVDDRRLEAAGSSDDGGSAGQSGQGSAVAGSAPVAQGGESGAGSAGGSSCADLDTDGIADCEVTLVETPSFADDVSGWAPVEEATLVWDERDALDDGRSGSAKLSATSPLASATQCVALDGAKLVIAYANTLVQAADEGADAQLAVSFYAEPGCTGERSGFFETPPGGPTGSWATAHAGGISPENTKSVSIALVGIRGKGASSLTAWFDNVMVKAAEP
jgi:hypothetical protein